MDSFTNGLTQGNFTLLQVLDPTTNQLVNILTLINNATGGVQTAQAPLALNAGVLSIDLSAYSTTTAIQIRQGIFRKTEQKKTNADISAFFLPSVCCASSLPCVSAAAEKLLVWL